MQVQILLCPQANFSETWACLRQKLPIFDSMDIELLAGQRRDGETDKAIQACNDWLRLGSGRTIPKLLDSYRQPSAIVSNFQPPSSSYKTLNTWSSRYGWPARATEFDAGWEARKSAEREAVLNYGLALDYERINELYQLAAFLKAQIYAYVVPDAIPETEPSRADAATSESDAQPKAIKGSNFPHFYNLWVRDVKAVGVGENAKIVDIERFNSPLVEQYRKTLDDIARETGGRVQKSDVTSGGEPLTGLIINIPSVDDDGL